MLISQNQSITVFIITAQGQLNYRWKLRGSTQVEPIKPRLRVTKKIKPLESTYTIKDHSPAEVSSKKYLGIILYKNPSWNDQTQKVCSKANSMLGVLRRNMSSCPGDVKDACYKTLVRPILEYSCTVWDPHTSKINNSLEMVQSRSVRFSYSNYLRIGSASDMITFV